MSEALADNVKKLIAGLSDSERETLLNVKPPPAQGLEGQPPHAEILACTWGMVHQRFSDHPLGRFNTHTLEELFRGTQTLIQTQNMVPLGDFPLKVIWAMSTTLMGLAQQGLEERDEFTREQLDKMFRNVCYLSAETILAAYVEIISSHAREGKLHNLIGDME